MSDLSLEKHVYLDAVLRPNRSLSKPAFFIVLGVIAAINLTTATAFFALGAFPVVGFLGLDVLAVYLAFRYCFRDQKQWTRVRVTADVLRVDHLNPKGVRSHVELPTYFTRIELDEPLKPTSWLKLISKSEAYVIGRFLTPDERKSLADRLRDAIADARQERFPVGA